jgi:hypothetical protein
MSEYMTRDEAEEIFMASQVGLFRGTESELAMAVLLLSRPRIDEDEQPTPADKEES